LTGGQRELEFLQEFKGRLLRSYSDRIRQVALFGSRATRNAREDSDYDVFIDDEPIHHIPLIEN
jgi:predicted nucleotidyltransferase